MAFRCFRRRGTYARWIVLGFALFILSQLYLTMEPTVSFREGNYVTVEHIVEKNIFDRDPADPDLINHIRKHLMNYLSRGSYNLTNDWTEDPAPDLILRIDNYLQKQRNGTYVDIYTKDGEQDSVTLFFERWRGWSGLLVEPSPLNYNIARKKRRGTTVINACLKTSKGRSTMRFEGKTIHCLWTKSILYALNIDTIDLLNIGRDGEEFDNLKSIPYDEFYFRVVAVGFSSDILPKIHNVFNYMDTKGFIALHQYVNGNKTDLIFVNKKNKLDFA